MTPGGIHSAHAATLSFSWLMSFARRAYFTSGCGYLYWVERWFCWCKFHFLVEELGIWLAAVV
jgi:hypothetical protein